MGRLIRRILVLCATIALSASTAPAVLIEDMGLILDTTTGIRWVPVSPLSGALAIEDLKPGQRYATVEEVDALINTYVFTRPLMCDYFAGPFCSPAVYQAVVDFIDIFEGGRLFPLPMLRAVYGPEGLPTQPQLAMFLTLYTTAEGGVFLDSQGTNFPLPIGDFGMLLVSTVPEPATLLLVVSGLCLVWRQYRRVTRAK